MINYEQMLQELSAISIPEPFQEAVDCFYARWEQDGAKAEFSQDEIALIEELYDAYVRDIG